MTAEVTPVELRTSPHIRRPMSTDKVMRHVAYSLVPVVAFAFYAFGISALLLIGVTTAACALTEHVVCKLSGKPSTVGDWSAVVTGLLLGLTLPPSFALWMGAVGGVVSIAMGKLLFGGLGFNVFNPALVGRAFLQAAFPVAITTWTPAFIADRFLNPIPSTVALPFMKPAEVGEYVKAAAVDGWSGATPLSLWKFDDVTTGTTDLLAGMTAGSVGETCSVLILLCGVYLAVRKMLDWRIPVGVLGSVLIFSTVLWLIDKEAYPIPCFMLFSGGLMLGAIYMATDMVTSPTTPLGIWIFAALIGIITVVVRIWGGLPEGVMYAILLCNALTPIIDNLTQPRVFGVTKEAATS